MSLQVKSETSKIQYYEKDEIDKRNLKRMKENFKNSIREQSLLLLLSRKRNDNFFSDMPMDMFKIIFWMSFKLPSDDFLLDKAKKKLEGLENASYDFLLDYAKREEKEILELEFYDGDDFLLFNSFLEKPVPVDILVEKGIELNHTNEYGRNVLYWLAIQERQKDFIYLKGKGADINTIWKPKVYLDDKKDNTKTNHFKTVKGFINAADIIHKLSEETIIFLIDNGLYIPEGTDDCLCPCDNIFSMIYEHNYSLLFETLKKKDFFITFDDYCDTADMHHMSCIKCHEGNECDDELYLKIQDYYVRRPVVKKLKIEKQ